MTDHPRRIPDAVCRRCGTKGLDYDRADDTLRCRVCGCVEHDLWDTYRTEVHRRSA